MAFDIDQVSWDDIRLFLLCVRMGSFRAAAQSSRLTASTMLRRMDAFERDIGVRLFERNHEGLALTVEGRRLWRGARQLEEGAVHLQRSIESFGPERRGIVRLFISEGLGSWWVTPRLVEMLRGNPLMGVHMKCGDVATAAENFDADAVVHFARQEAPDMERVQIGMLHVYPFAAPSYLERYGRPTCVSDLTQHRIVDQAGPDLDPGLIPRLLRLPDVESLVSFRTNSATAHVRAIEEGAGIGGLPTYARILGAAVEPVDLAPGVAYSIPIWLGFRAQGRKTPRVNLLIELIEEAFDPTRYPWFAPNFIHPLELERITAHDMHARGEALSPSGAGRAMAAFV